MSEKLFLRGQLYELTQLLAEAVSMEEFELRPYILKRLKDLNKNFETSSPSVRRSSRGETKEAL